MRFFFALAFFVAAPAWAACPNFSGTFLIGGTKDFLFQFEQSSCDRMLRHGLKEGDPVPSRSQTIVVDGKKREGFFFGLEAFRWEGNSLVWNGEGEYEIGPVTGKGRISLNADGNLLEEIRYYNSNGSFIHGTTYVYFRK